MADGGAEDACLLWAIFICPGHDIVIRLFGSILPLYLLLASSQGARCIKNMDVVVKFLVDRRPIRKVHHDWTCRLRKTDCNRQLRSMAAGLQSQIFKPITMRRAWCNGIIRLANAIA